MNTLLRWLMNTRAVEQFQISDLRFQMAPFLRWLTVPMRAGRMGELFHEPTPSRVAPSPLGWERAGVRVSFLAPNQGGRTSSVDFTTHRTSSAFLGLLPLPIRWGEGRGEGAAFGSGDRLVSRQRPTIPQSRATPWEYRHPVSPSPERAKPSPPAEKPAATWRSNPSGIGHSCPLRAVRFGLA